MFFKLKVKLVKWFNLHNVIICDDINNDHYYDRDEIMFHSIFQILVDFVELEQPLKSSFISHIPGRFTDTLRMEKWVNSITDNMDKLQDIDVKALTNLQKRNLEILELYKWYKTKLYDYDTYMKSIFPGFTFDSMDINDLIDYQNKHIAICNLMLDRVIKIRQFLWT